VFEKLLGHLLVKGMLPSYYSNISIVKHNQEVVENLKDGLSFHLVGEHNSKLVVAKDIVYTLASSQSLSSGQGITKVLGVDKRNIKNGIELCILLDTQSDTFWLSSRKAKRVDALFESYIRKLC
jgi:hypothetical protein